MRPEGCTRTEAVLLVPEKSGGRVDRLSNGSRFPSGLTRYVSMADASSALK